MTIRIDQVCDFCDKKNYPQRSPGGGDGRS